MRIAYVQGGANLEPIETQIARLQSLAPDQYRIEEAGSGPARQRRIEFFDRLRAGDQVLVATLAVLAPRARDVAQMLLRFAHRGVGVWLVRQGSQPIPLHGDEVARTLIEDFAEVDQAWGDPPAKAAVTAEVLLSEAEVADIRRLARAGLSPRRIGFIYRRSPRCIAEVLCEAPATDGAPTT